MRVEKIIITLVAVLLLAASFSVFAANADKKVGAGPNPFRDCGIGAALFSETHWAAVTSNVIWDVGSTAVTSATMSPETCSNFHIKTAKFIIDNYDKLIEDAAKGGGEHIVAVLDIEGCSSNVQTDVIAVIRNDMSDKVGSAFYAQKDKTEKATDYYNAVTSASSNCMI